MRPGILRRSLLALVLAMLAAGCRTRLVDYSIEGDSADPLTAEDLDGDGFSTEQGDCDDQDPEVHPGADERCNGEDDDCDGEADEDAVDSSTWNIDYDADGYGSALYTLQQCEQPSGYVLDGSDCDDTDANVRPNAEEHCDGVDEDCDGQTDEEAVDASTWSVDGDGDGIGSSLSALVQCEQPSGYVLEDGDCDDDDATIHPGADEHCDGLDNDCDGSTDESGSLDESAWYADADGDGYGDGASPTDACDQPKGHVSDDSDCDDSDVAINPDADEHCDGVDNDCDGELDEASAVDAVSWYRDSDGDGFGDAANSSTACSQPSGYVSDDSDCDDHEATVYTGADERCDGLDNDCDGSTDESGALDESTWYADADGDGFGDAASSRDACDQPSGHVSDDSDCDDGDAAINPQADEHCDGVDEDCDGTADEDALDASTLYVDADGDGFGDADQTAQACEAGSGLTDDDADCDDGDAAVSPDADELCDGLDNDCDGETDEPEALDAGAWHPDLDGDGYGDGSAGVTSCSRPAGYLADGSDCDDGDAAVHPAASETCNELDDDCDGLTDDEDSDLVGDAWYADGDGDGWGDSAAVLYACAQPSGHVSDGGDCDDGDTAFHPDATEDDCTDPSDYNCDGSTGYADADGDGFAACEDCDDGDAAVSQGGTWYLDADGDGYGVDSSTTTACGQPSGFADNSDDCDDGDASVQPGASELCDGLDNDCDGSVDEDGMDPWYLDADGDGYGDPAELAHGCEAPSGYVDDDSDCDDADLAVNPDAEEICGNGVDDDCDGTGQGCGLWGELSLSEAEDIWWGEAVSDAAGTALAPAGDQDGDGLDDFLVGTQDAGSAEEGRVYLVQGCASGGLDLGTALAVLSGEGAGDHAGIDLAGGVDFDGDAWPDLLLGARHADGGSVDVGVAYLLRGPVSGAVDLGSADLRLEGLAYLDNAGSAVDFAGDVDGDGYQDLIVGAYAADPGGLSEAGEAYLVCGPGSGTISLGSATATIAGEANGDEVGTAACGPGDLDGDGFDDLLVGSCVGTSFSTTSGELYVFYGPVSGSLASGDADAAVVATGSGAHIGVTREQSAIAAAGDADGDGYADLLLGGTYDSSAATHGGAAYLLCGPVSGVQDVAAAQARLIGSEDDAYAGWAVDAGADLDADGQLDLVVGAPGADVAATDAGAVYVLYGPLSGSISLDDGDAVITGESAGDEAGIATCLPGDLDGDGIDDLLVGASGEDSGGGGSGAVYLLLGGGL